MLNSSDYAKNNASTIGKSLVLTLDKATMNGKQYGELQ